MRMPEKLEVLNFSADFSYYIKASNLLPIQYLHSNFMPSQFMFAKLVALLIFLRRFRQLLPCGLYSNFPVL